MNRDLFRSDAYTASYQDHYDTVMVCDLVTGNYVIIPATVFDAIHAALHADEPQSEPVKRTCGGCRYISFGDCMVNPPDGNDRGVFNERVACRFWEAK